jgi:hypothetical protein
MRTSWLEHLGGLRAPARSLYCYNPDYSSMTVPMCRFNRYTVYAYGSNPRLPIDITRSHDLLPR